MGGRWNLPKLDFRVRLHHFICLNRLSADPRTQVKGEIHTDLRWSLEDAILDRAIRLGLAKVLTDNTCYPKFRNE